MPIAIFSNDNQEKLFLIIEPGGDRYEIPHQGKGGVRYTLEAGKEDRSFSEIRRNEIHFWCNAESHEVEIVRPSPFDVLLWELCVVNGFCGRGSCHVTDLLPAQGMVSAEQFAEFAIQAECEGPTSSTQYREWAGRLVALFTKHFGTSVMPAAALQMNVRLPFDPPED